MKIKHSLPLKHSLQIIGFTAWSGLGFFRGINSYKYYNNKYGKNEYYSYVNSTCNGFVGILIYANPFLLPITVYKELYRLEVNLRNLENEKNTSFYNYLLYG